VTNNHDFIIGPTDTDSISFCKQDGSPFSKEERTILLKEINDLSPELILWEDDGYYPIACALKAKNYILKTESGKVKVKGSALTDKKKEPALKEMIDAFIESITTEADPLSLVDIYHDYIKEAHNVQDISRWCSKKTITKAVLECVTNEAARLNERKVYDAVKDIPGLQEGDKVHLYPCIISQHEERKEFKNGNVKIKVIKETGLKLLDRWTCDHDSEKLVDRVVATTNIFNNLLGDDVFIDYTKAKNKDMLLRLLPGNERC